MSSMVAWIPNPDVRKRVIAKKTLLLNIKNNRLLVLNEQAAAIWGQLSDSEILRESDIVRRLRNEYLDTSTEKLEADVHSLLLNLRDRGFVYQGKKSCRPQTPSGSKNSDVSGHLSFSERLHQLAMQHNIPISGGLEITQRCHLRCMHCYVDSKPIGHRDELSTKKLCNLLDQIAEEGCLWLLITGGEPLLRKDFCEVYCHAKNLGMIVTIFTSATNLAERIADVLTEYPPFLVESTLHGVTETIFDTISGIRGSFHRFLKGIRLLRERKIPFHLKMSVMRQNVHEVEAARQVALEMGAGDFRFDPMINADFLHSSKATNLRVTVEQAIKLDLLEPYKNRGKRIYGNAAHKRATSNPPKGLLFPCRAGKCSFTISSDGQLLPCILIRSPAYNLQRMSFSEAWKELNRYTTTARMKRNNPCLRCRVQTCSRCPAWGYLEHGDPNAKSQFACTLQEQREKIFLP